MRFGASMLKFAKGSRAFIYRPNRVNGSNLRRHCKRIPDPSAAPGQELLVVPSWQPALLVRNHESSSEAPIGWASLCNSEA